MLSSAKREQKQEGQVRPIFAFVCTHRSGAILMTRKLLELYRTVIVVDLKSIPTSKISKVSNFNGMEHEAVVLHNDEINAQIATLPKNSIVIDVTDFNLGHPGQDVDSITDIAANLKKTCTARELIYLNMITGSGNDKLVEEFKKTEITAQSDKTYIHIDNLKIAKQFLQSFLALHGVTPKKSTHRIIQASLSDPMSPVSISSPSRLSVASDLSSPASCGFRSPMASPVFSDDSQQSDFSSPSATPINSPAQTPKFSG